ncbi:MAG TPA: hypothetical protein PKD84_13085 [Propionicimonas sp.]|nr:hypothetical protein [Propionicimonas sp.]
MTALRSEYSWVHSAPFRAHLRLLLDRTGLPWPVMALAADVPHRLVGRLLNTPGSRRLEKLPAETAQRLLGLTHHTLTELSRQQVPAQDTSRILAALLADGCPPTQLARYCRLSRSELSATLASPTCSRLTALLAQSARLQYRTTG